MSELGLVCPECGEKRLAHAVVSTCPRDADRTATLARELAEARERLARVEAVRDQLARTHNTTHELVQTGRADPDVRDFIRRVHDDLSSALHAPADAPQGDEQDPGKVDVPTPGFCARYEPCGSCHRCSAPSAGAGGVQAGGEGS